MPRDYSPLQRFKEVPARQALIKTQLRNHFRPFRKIGKLCGREYKVTVAKAPAKRVQHFIQHHTTLLLYELLHSFGHLVVSCCIVLYLAV